MNDLVERLRTSCENGILPEDIYEAADRIEALEFENEGLRLGKDLAAQQRIEALEAELVAKDAEITALKAQDWVTPLLRWDGRICWLGRIYIGQIAHGDQGSWKWFINGTGWNTGWSEGEARDAVEKAVREALRVKPVEQFQARVQPWMLACFSAEISTDRVERGDRLLEEVLELLQSGGYDPARVEALRDYVWGRPAGEPSQEVGGVMVTLAAYCLAHDLDMHDAGEVELARINQPEIIEKIRKKQAAKPKRSALPIASPHIMTPWPREKVAELDHALDIALAQPEPARTCETCTYEEVNNFADPCCECGWADRSKWTPKTTDSEESAP